MCIQNFHVTNKALENRGQSVPSPSLTQRLCNSSAQTGTDSEVIQSCSRPDTLRIPTESKRKSESPHKSYEPASLPCPGQPGSQRTERGFTCTLLME